MFVQFLPPPVFEALVELTATRMVWDADSQDERLRLAYVQFSRACKAHGVSGWDLGYCCKVVCNNIL